MAAIAGLGTMTAAYAALQVLGRRSGSRADERARVLPGDHLVQPANLVTDHAASIAATPEQIWPWLTQVGWHRAGWYTAEWVDRLLFPANWPSPDRLDPALTRDLRVGDTVPDGPPGTAEFVVEHVDAPRMLVLHSTTHAPASWRERCGVRIDWVWTFALDPDVGGGSRMHIRTRARTGPWWFTAAYLATLVPADHIMATSMLRGLRRRVEDAASASRGQLVQEPGRSGAADAGR